MTLETIALIGVAVISASLIALALAFHRVAGAVVNAAHSLRQLTGEMDKKVDRGLENLNDSLSDVKEITGQIKDQMGRVDAIVENVEQITGNARSSMRMVDSTVSPLLANLHSVMAGLRKGMETWRDYDGNGQAKPETDSKGAAGPDRPAAGD